MARRLAELANISAKLTKAAGKSSLLGAAAKLMKKHPVGAASTIAGVGLSGLSAKGAYDQNKAGFEPDIQKLKLGPTEE